MWNIVKDFWGNLTKFQKIQLIDRIVDDFFFRCNHKHYMDPSSKSVY